MAFGSGQDVVTRERSGLIDASSGESDRYEELLVNPTLLTLAAQRGDIDCGGLRYLVVAYRNFWQLGIRRWSSSQTLTRSGRPAGVLRSSTVTRITREGSRAAPFPR